MLQSIVATGNEEDGAGDCQSEREEAITMVASGQSDLNAFLAG